MKEYKSVSEIDSDLAKSNFDEKAEQLALALRNFSLAWEQLEVYTDVNTLEEPYTKVGEIFNGSLDEVACDFNSWVDNLEYLG